MNIPRTIYAIQHNVTKKMYIGSSQNPEGRYRSHISNLRVGKHPVEDMQEDFDKYGEDFSLYFLEEITSRKDRRKEYEWMEKYGTVERGIGYNYKDNYVRHSQQKTNLPIKTGLPDEIVDEKKELHKLVDLLTEHETAYTIAFLNRVFNVESRKPQSKQGE